MGIGNLDAERAIKTLRSEDATSCLQRVSAWRRQAHFISIEIRGRGITVCHLLRHLYVIFNKDVLYMFLL